MIQRHIVFGLLLVAASGLLTTSAFADDFHHHRDTTFWARPYLPPQHVDRFSEGHHESFYRRHHHDRCREQYVPYWDAYWGVWSQRVERVCW